MSKFTSKIVNNWIMASKDLGFKLEAPYTLQEGEKKIDCIAYLPDFGSKNGMIIDLIYPPEYKVTPGIEGICQKLGLFYSSINLEIYKEYDKTTYTEALIDWCYFGSKDNKPDWIK